MGPKTKLRIIIDLPSYNVTAGRPTWKAAAGCLYRERLGEREGNLDVYIIHISEYM
jgi:hypothetical protein